MDRGDSERKGRREGAMEGGIEKKREIVRTCGCVCVCAPEIVIPAPS